MLTFSNSQPPPSVSFLQDKTYDFEKKRNKIVKYDRELVQKTVRAMKRIAEIRAARERAFMKARFTLAKKGEVKEGLKELEKYRETNKLPAALRVAKAVVKAPAATVKRMDTDS